MYASAQRRKIRPFEGFQRKAIVIVPTDEEYKARYDKRTADEGKEVPDSAVLEMKGIVNVEPCVRSFVKALIWEIEFIVDSLLQTQTKPGIVVQFPISIPGSVLVAFP